MYELRVASNIWMLEHNRIDISEGIDVNKTNASKEYDIKKAMRFNDVAVVYVKGSAYRIYFWYMNTNSELA